MSEVPLHLVNHIVGHGEGVLENNYFTETCSGSEAGSYLRLIDSCITQLKAQGPSRNCHESKEEEERCDTWSTTSWGMAKEFTLNPRRCIQDSHGQIQDSQGHIHDSQGHIQDSQGQILTWSTTSWGMAKEFLSATLPSAFTVPSSAPTTLHTRTRLTDPHWICSRNSSESVPGIALISLQC